MGTREHPDHPRRDDRMLARHDSEGTERDHTAIVYGDERALATAFAGSFAGPLHEGDAVLVVATPKHLAAFASALRREGLDLEVLRDAGRYVERDARTALERLLEGGVPDPERLAGLVGEALPLARSTGRRLHVYGEMVALLWDDDLVNAVLALEQQWNVLIDRWDLSLHCGYPLRASAEPSTAGAFARVCALHRDVRGVPVATHPGPAPGRTVPGGSVPGVPSRGVDSGGSVPGVLPDAEATTLGVPDTLDGRLVVLDDVGRILAVNAAWASSARENGAAGAGVGADYFAVCEVADDPIAGRALAGLWSIASDATTSFTLEYPCSTPDGPRWFRMTASRYDGSGPARIVVRHDAITAGVLVREADRRPHRRCRSGG